MALFPGQQGFAGQTLSRASFAKEPKLSNAGKPMDLKDVECFKCHKKWHYANKRPDAKAKDGKGFFKVRRLEEPSIDKTEEKSKNLDLSVRSESDLRTPFFAIGSISMIWQGRDELHPGYLAHVFLDTGANCNTTIL